MPTSIAVPAESRARAVSPRLDSCPRCSRGGVLYSSSASRNLLRSYLGSGKRYCPDCAHRWKVPRSVRLGMMGKARSILMALDVGPVSVVVLRAKPVRA